MNITEMRGYLDKFKAKLKQKFAILTENDHMFVEGKKEEMVAKLQLSLSKTKEELNKMIEACKQNTKLITLVNLRNKIK